MSRRYLIVNADDFGQCAEVNRGIMEAHEHGIVTSASLMVRWPAAVEAALYARTSISFSVGLHVDLGEWVYKEQGWTAVYEVVPTRDRSAVAREVRRQLKTFRDLVGSDPTHLDSHQHVHREEPVRSILVEVGQQLGIPLRHYHPQIRYCGDFYGQTAKGLPRLEDISIEALLRIFANVPVGLSELACHPSRGGHPSSMYAQERDEELKVLCHPRARAALLSEQIQLCSFRSAGL